MAPIEGQLLVGKTELRNYSSAELYDLVLKDNTWQGQSLQDQPLLVKVAAQPVATTADDRWANSRDILEILFSRSDRVSLTYHGKFISVMHRMEINYCVILKNIKLREERG